jgi:subtilase family serine protease
VGKSRQGRRRWLVVAVFAILATVGFGSIQLAGASQPSATKQVSGFLTALSKATRLSAAPASTQLTVGVGVATPNPAAEHAYYNELYDPSSSIYHDFLTPKQFNARFGVPAATVAKVESFLTSTGARISSASDSGDYITITATVSQLASLFKVSFGEYRYQGSNFIANNQPATVPAALPITDTLGLNTFSKFSLAPLTGHTLAAAKASAAADVAAGKRLIAQNAAAKTRAATAVARAGSSGAKSGPAAVTPAQAGSEMVFTPQDLWGMYNDPGAAALTNANGTSTATTLENSTTALGQGQTVGVFGVGEMASIIPQLRLFEEAEGFPKVPVRTVETEGGPDSAYGGFSPDAIEWYLDSQSSTGMAPDVKQLDLYFAKNFLDADIENEFSNWAGDANGPKQMNASFGECEGNPLDPVTEPTEGDLPIGVAEGYSLEETVEATLEKAAMEGRTLFTSAGDTGSGCPEVAVPVVGAGNGLVDQPVPDAGYPCASDYAVCVGGTVLSSKGTTYPTSAQRDDETAWEYGGGGSSYFIPEGSFQAGVTAISTDCVSQPDGTPYSPAPVCRAVPDVSDLSGNVDGDAYFIYSEGAPSSEGGTSLSSPLMMGQWARMQSAEPAAKQTAGTGFADPVIYTVAKGADSCDTGTAASLQTEVVGATPCTDPTYNKDFYDITEGEDAGDTAGAEGAGSITAPITGFNNVNTGVGTPNGAYFPAPGWDYNTGWGALNVSNFMTTVDGSTTAADTYTGTELPAINVSRVVMGGPADSADDPVSGVDDKALNVTAATLSATASTITATIVAPDIATGPPADAAGGDQFYVDWDYNGKVYYAEALESLAGTFTYSSGSTATGFATNTTNSAAQGTVNMTTGAITITEPTSEVGKPTQCSVLTVPQAFSALDEGAAGVDDISLASVDELDTYRGYSVDGGQSDSIGENLIVGGTSACGLTEGTFPALTSTSTSTSTSTAPTTTKSGTGTAVLCEKTSKLPVTHITKKSLARTKISLSGYAQAHCPDKITKVGIAIARTVIRTVKVRRATRTVKVKRRECEFLTTKHRFTAAGSCAPRDYLTAKGTAKWSFSLKFKFSKATYRIWEHATDNKKYSTKNTAGKFVFFRVS